MKLDTVLCAGDTTMNKIDMDISFKILAKGGHWKNKQLLYRAHVTLMREAQDAMGTQNRND